MKLKYLHLIGLLGILFLILIVKLRLSNPEGILFFELFEPPKTHSKGPIK